MILRHVKNLEPGMTIRLPHPRGSEQSVFNVRVVNPNSGPFGRWAIGFGIGDEGYVMNFFPDDLVEVII